MVHNMFEPLVEVYRRLRELLPDSLKPGRPRFNYITVHCKAKQRSALPESAWLIVSQILTWSAWPLPARLCYTPVVWTMSTLCSSPPARPPRVV